MRPIKTKFPIVLTAQKRVEYAIEIIAAICAIVVITKYSELEQAIAYQLRTDDMPEFGEDTL
ncbi:MAG: hypothetical protein ACI9M3_001538 [Bacteroidia bacterium]